MRQLIALVAVLALVLGLGTPATAAPITIDNFTGVAGPLGAAAGAYVGSPPANATFSVLANNPIPAQPPLRGFSAGGPMNFAPGPYPTIIVNETGVSGVLGGNRTTQLNFKTATIAGTNNFTINTTSGVLSYNADNGILGGLSLVYTFAATDFSDTDGILLTFANNNVGGPGQALSVTTTVFDTGTSSSISPTVPQSGSPQTLFIPFANMLPAPNTPGGADLSALTQIRFDFNITGNGGQSFGLANISAVQIPEPTTLAVCGLVGLAGLVSARRKLKAKKAAETATAA